MKGLKKAMVSDCLSCYNTILLANITALELARPFLITSNPWEDSLTTESVSDKE
jgi:hypothetical protein